MFYKYLINFNKNYLIMKTILMVFVVVLMFGCKAKIKTIETHTTDTLQVTKVVKIIPPQLNNLVIDNPCDSLGNLKPFNYKIKSGKTTAKIEVKDNKIILETNTDSIKEVAVKEYIAKHKVVAKETIKYKIPKIFWYSLLLNLLFLVYTFRKFIPFLKILPI